KAARTNFVDRNCIVSRRISSCRIDPSAHPLHPLFQRPFSVPPTGISSAWERPVDGGRSPPSGLERKTPGPRLGLGLSGQLAHPLPGRRSDCLLDPEERLQLVDATV